MIYVICPKPDQVEGDIPESAAISSCYACREDIMVSFSSQEVLEVNKSAVASCSLCVPRDIDHLPMTEHMVRELQEIHFQGDEE